MTQITMEDFKKHRIFILVTGVLGLLTVIYSMVKPEYANFQEAAVAAFFLIPLGAWWLLYFWNIVVVKLFAVKPISWGVAVFLTLALTVLFS